jgi:hypothetical protein
LVEFNEDQFLEDRQGWLNKCNVNPGCINGEGECIIEPRTDRQEQSTWRNYLGIDLFGTLKIHGDC